MSRSSMLAAALFLGACAPTTNATAWRQAAPKASAAEVAVFTDARPGRPFEEIGTIEVTASELSDDRYGELIRRARRDGARMGGDAIIVTRDATVRTTGIGYFPAARKRGGQVIAVSGRPVERPRIQVTVVVWKEE